MVRHAGICAALLLAAGLFYLWPSQSARSPDAIARSSLSQIDGAVRVAGLRSDVHVFRDSWGVPHIYAQSTEDLFFAQGFVMAQDRLWQMETWRRAAEGTLAEILGSRALPRDRLARLLKYRGPIDDRELTVYHADAHRIMTAYIGGVNAFIAEAEHSGRLPVEFGLTGIRPGRWTIASLVLRQTTFGDATDELQLARSVAALGPEEANRRRNPDPFEPLAVPPGLDVTAITDSVLAATHSGPAPRAQLEPGSNNWVVSGTLSTTGKPVVANDPHREVTNPSLRYIVHLNAPGWNVAGASEPPFLGVALGHNERLAWGLTIVGTDQHDVYVEELNPSDHSQVKWKGGWEPIRTIVEEIRVKGTVPERYEMTFTRHGPVFHVDRERHRAYVLRSALHEPGTAPYLAGLRLSQARDCRTFLAEAAHWNAPSENLICGDVDSTIAWRPSALTPSREGWTGRLPVPGTGAYEWQGFRSDLPTELNPERGFIATANNNVQPRGYSPPFMFKTADTRFDRIARLLQLIQPGRTYSLDDHARIQHDAYSLRAAEDLALFAGWTSGSAAVERARRLLEKWDATYRRDSAEAALYEAWRTAGGHGRGGRSAATAGAAPVVSGFSRTTREDIEQRLQQAVDRLTSEQGPDWRAWRWGRMHMRAFPHPVLPAFDIPPVERGGGAGTVAADGASYRQILDVSDWDRSLVINTPGQSGQPGSPYYSNLVREWADDKYFPLAFSRSAVEKVTAHRLTLQAR